MRQTTIWFFLTCKRYLKKISFILILLVLPAASYFLRQVEQEEGQEVWIAVCEESKDEAGERVSFSGQVPLERQLAQSLLEKNGSESGLFHFYLCDSEEQVKEDVAARRAECGYVISADLRMKLDQKDYRRCIRVYSAPSTVLAPLSTEVVFAALMELYDREIFVNYIGESELVREAVTGLAVSDTKAEALKEQAGTIYDKWMGNGSTFRFEYKYGKERGQVLDNSLTPHVFPVRGIVAVYLFLTGLYSGVMLGNDEKRGLFLPLTAPKRRLCGLAALAAPVFLAALSGMAALKTGGCFENPGKEAAALGLYCIAICIFSGTIKFLCRTPRILCCMIPLFLVGSLLFTPVIVDISEFFPAFSQIGKLFLPFYYLKVF